MKTLKLRKINLLGLDLMIMQHILYKLKHFSDTMRNRKTNLQPTQQPQRITEDISPDRSGGILKTILREGAGDVRPGDGWTVFVHYTGSFENGDKFDSSRDRGPPFDFQIGQEDVIKGV